jgi:ABC-type dipeptide/oligopeptide/nickel transport system permease subunit
MAIMPTLMILVIIEYTLGVTLGDTRVIIPLSNETFLSRAIRAKILEPRQRPF